MANQPHLVRREISTLSLSLHMWHPVTTRINLFQIYLSGVAVSGGCLERFSGSS